jgi:hypothetical protein
VKIQSKDVLQADSLDRVMMSIGAIAAGAKTDDDIAEAIGGLSDRQGRYYRRATEILGFSERTQNNASTLTKLGKLFQRANATDKNAIILSAILNNPVFVRLVSFIESRGSVGASRTEIETFLASVAELGQTSMAGRRTSTYLSWLRHLGLVNETANSFILNSLPSSVPLVTVESDEEPLLPAKYDLLEYQDQSRRVKKSEEAIQFFANQALLERANSVHSELVNLMAQKIRKHGSIPRTNRYVDLSARIDDRDYLFEMKSTTEKNLHHQARRGLSQLYEYRYIQNVPDAKLVLVLETPLTDKMSWMNDYILKDRNVLLVWDGNNRFYCPESISDQLAFI